MFGSKQKKEFDEILRRHVQYLAPAVQFSHSPLGSRMQRVGSIRQAPENARINQHGHYS